ncbi:hypothetical protein PV08_04491 [Exophiala spinifera]|uniref:RNA helicase n=1 Tax=Exophiala spinifera TaxID=91928 RepID=A0A0D2BFA2_9EURO|nr:uncharacterized protein PV08_04491 [Exophiala spinifera]KIW17300.1 hypothetical protein PV08_04491 [Exophiala spinifera]
MAPNKKKKKAVANPARGFATTSVPSKTKLADEPNENVAESSTSTTPQDAQILENGDGATQSHLPKTSQKIEDMTPEQLEAHLEDSELEAFVEKYSSRCDADASRQVTRLETERRQLRLQAHKLSTYPWLPQQSIGELFAMNALWETMKDGMEQAPLPSSAEEKVLLDLWTLERVLQALKFPRVLEAVTHVAGLALSGRLSTSSDSLPGLTEAFQWYALGEDAEDLSSYEHTVELRPGNSGSSTPVLFDSGTPSANDSWQSPAGTPAQVSEPEDDYSPNVSSGSEEDDDPAKLTERYVRIKRLLWDLENPLQPGKSSSTSRRQKQIVKLKGKLQSLCRDPLLDEYEAESSWRVIMDELQEDRRQILREESWRRREIEQAGPSERDNSLPKAKTLAPGAEVDVNGEDGLLGGMFGEESENATPDPATKPQGDIKLVDFGKWSGVSPKKLLDDTCKGYDAKCRIQTRILQSTSHSTRHSLEISWSVELSPDEHAISALPSMISTKITSTNWTFAMETIAAATTIQSEAYICSQGLFVVSSLGSKEQKAIARLPTVWRELVRDLADEKQRLVNEEHKEILRRLRNIIQAIQEEPQHEKSDGVTTQRAKPTLATDRRRPRPTPSRLDPDQISKDWLLRTSRPSFQQMLEVRQSLPVHQYKDNILSCIANNPVTVICAETGAGKSSGIPVLILERQFGNGQDCRILVTQPRRISAVTLARRVSQELGENRNEIGTSKSLVGYAIRLESKTSSSTRITYATTGVLLRMLEESPNLEELDYLILDEVHERTMDLDLLFIALQKLQRRRESLKIILMSATVDARKFSDYFGGAPVLDLPGRTFPVEVGFLEDAVEATLGLTGARDQSVALEEEEVDFEGYDNRKGRPMILEPEKYSGKTQALISQMDEYRIDYNLIAKLSASIATKCQYAKYSSAILIFMPGIGEMRRLHNLLLSMDTFSHGWVVHLLHSTFSTDDLEKAFERPPLGHRKIVIATNIAETGITIPDVTAVIDTCKEKVMRFDERRQLSRLTEGFISRSSARQRRGRAARVQEGLCFHLVTKHRHDTLMLEQQVPEMLRLSLQDPMLRIKVWNLGSIEETLNAAIDPPSRKNVLRAIEKLKDAGALTKTEALTPLGQQIARLPLEVSLAKLAIFGVIFRCLDPILAIVSLLTSKSPFLASSAAAARPDARQTFSRADSDLLSSFNAYEAWRRAKAARSAQDFCRKNHISDQTMSQIEEQKVQLLVYLVDAGLASLDLDEKAVLNRARSGPGRGSNINFYIVPERYNQTLSDRALNGITAMALYPRILAREGKGWRNVYTNQQVSLTSRSINHNNPKAPRWLSFFEAMQNRSGNLNVFETSAIPESTLVALLGEAEFKFYAGVMVLDSGKIKISVKHWRQLMAIKILRERLLYVLEIAYKKPGQGLEAADQQWVDMWLKIEASQES